jgi:heme oxygenase
VRRAVDSVALSDTLSTQLREGTRAQHTRAERSGFIADLLRGRGQRTGYVLLLRNLLPAYRALEQGLERHGTSPAFAGLAWPALFRASALERDLDTLAGPGWSRSIALLPEGMRYAEVVTAASAGAGHGLLAHAYTRYLGDLSGGQVIGRLLGRSLGIGEEALSFYRFAAIADPDAFKRDFRRALDAAGPLVDGASIVDEAVAAFELNIALSEAIRRAV